MIEINSNRKMKINLSDYDYFQDLKNRVKISKFSELEKRVLQEILFSSVNIAKHKLQKALCLEATVLDRVLSKLQEMELISIEDETITVDKTTRKTMEFEMKKFEENFYPDMRFFQSLLKKVPIHLLPIWYAIPKTTDNIFESILEKFLITPHHFQRVLSDFFSAKEIDPIVKEIVTEVFQSKTLSIPKKEVSKKYPKLPKEKLEEYLIFLEYSCLCSTVYKEEGAVIVPFKEWTDYLLFLEKTTPKPLKNFSPSFKKFSYVTFLETFLKMLKKKPFSSLEDFSLEKSQAKLLEPLSLQLKISIKEFFSKVVEKLLYLGLIEKKSKNFSLSTSGQDFLALPLEEKALFFYRHPQNQPYLTFAKNSPYYDRHLREVEKSLLRVLDMGWVSYSEFLKSLTISLSDASSILLKKQGSFWQYTLPTYSEQDFAFIQHVLDWFFVVGIVEKNLYHEEECFCLTDFGKKLFGR